MQQVDGSVRFGSAVDEVLVEIKVSSAWEVERLQVLPRFPDEAHEVQWEQAVQEGKVVHQRRRATFFSFRWLQLFPCLVVLCVVLLFFLAFFVALLILSPFCVLLLRLAQLVPTKESAIDQEQLWEVMIGGKSSTDVGQKHDQYYKGKLDYNGGGIDEEALLQMLQEGCVEDQV